MSHVMRYTLLIVAGLLSLFSYETYVRSSRLEATRHSDSEKLHRPMHFQLL